jgi:type II secretory ATPase GspE/PulE/Tfp pilus assembly ATPase PilB-like protein
VEAEALRSGDVLVIGAAQVKFVDPTQEETGGTYSAASVGEEDVLTEDDIVVEDEGSEDEAGFEVIDDEEAGSPDDAVVEVGAGSGGGGARAGGTVASMPSSGGDPERALEAIAESLPDGGVREGEIVLLNSRGAVTHVAKGGKGGAAGGGKREPVEFFRLLLVVCIRSRTTDIHLEPRQDCYGVRLRVDGVMVDVAKLDQTFGVRVSTLVKVLSDIDIAQRNALQEGHFTAKVPSGRGGRGSERRIDYRVSFAPSVFGQKLVIRILDAENAPLTLSDMKLPGWMQTRLEDFVEQDAGMVVVAGPTGSGKTTTLYSLLRSIDLSRRNAVTIEDPVEMQLEGTTQMPVDEAGGKSFGAILRSVLRQDPDVIMVGEIRDAETARTAMQAAITGHMVLSSIHTRDTLGTVYRLLDLGVEPYLVSQALNIVVAQRLVRQLCPACRKKVRANEVQKKALEGAGYSGEAVWVPVGCARCLGTGHSGRRGVFEMLQVTDELRGKIQDNAPLEELRTSLAGTEFVSLGKMGMGLVAEGSVSFEEVDRIGKK